MPKINKLPINAGIIKFTSQMVNAAAKIPMALLLYN